MARFTPLTPVLLRRNSTESTISCIVTSGERRARDDVAVVLFLQNGLSPMIPG